MNILMLLSLAASLLSGTPNAAHVRQASELIQAAQSAMEPGGGFLSAKRGRVAAGGSGSDVQIMNGTSISGDLNGDGMQDEAVIVKRLRTDGSTEFDLAVLIHEGGALFNITDTPVATNPRIFSEKIANGKIVIDMAGDNAARAVSTFELLGNELIKTS